MIKIGRNKRHFILLRTVGLYLFSLRALYDSLSCDTRKLQPYHFNRILNMIKFVASKQINKMFKEYTLEARKSQKT